MRHRIRNSWTVSRLVTPSVLAILVVSLTFTASACGSSDDQPSGPPDWTLRGKTGSVAVFAPAESAPPRVTVTAPFAVDATTVHTITAGGGAVVPSTASVSVDYLGVNGRTGTVFDSSYKRGEPANFSLSSVVPGFSKAIVGQKVGSTVAVAMVPADGYPQGNSDAGIDPGDTLVFVIKIMSSQ